MMQCHCISLKKYKLQHQPGPNKIGIFWRWHALEGGVTLINMKSSHIALQLIKCFFFKLRKIIGEDVEEPTKMEYDRKDMETLVSFNIIENFFEEIVEENDDSI
jgi:hypothetical protein